jgi:hypothetical protein
MYVKIDTYARQHLLTFIKWLYDETISSGGDGDGLWYSYLYNVEDIFPLVQEVNNSLRFPWDIEIKDGTIYWGRGQEGLIITNNKTLYDQAPSWQQILIKYYTTLWLWRCRQVRDLTPLTGMPLTTLHLGECDQLRDLTPLHGMNLTDIQIDPRNIIKGMEALRGMNRELYVRNL